MTTPNVPVPRDNVKQVACPKCRSGPGQQCQGYGGKIRKANHWERVKHYKEVNGL